jgi:lipopolysaccharide transport system permease protein
VSSSPTAGFAEGRRLRIDSRPRWFPDLGALRRARQLLLVLSRRNITVKYRQTVLGTAWLFGGPLVSAGLFTFVFGRVAKLPSDGVPYFAFSYAGLLGWNFFSTILSAVATSLSSNEGLISKIYFPRLVLPLSTTASTLVNTAISFGIMLALLVIYHIGFTLHLLVLPFWLLLAMMFAMGIGLVLAAGSVSYRDVNYVTPMFTQLFLYLSPVAYGLTAVPAELRGWYLLNPLTTIIEGCRWSLLGSASLSGWAIAYTVVLAVSILAGGLAIFARLESSFADVI